MTRRFRAVQATDLLGLREKGGHLCLEVPEGCLALYHYAPLRLAHACGQRVPFASEWAEHLKPFVYAYAPVPELTPELIPEAWRADFGVQERHPHGLRPGRQATFRGWPLYLYLPDQPGQAPGGELEHLFLSVPTDLRALSPSPCAPWGP